MMTKSKPLLSIILPVYNGEDYLAHTIDSVLSQSFQDFEFIIINDSSTDSSEEIILSYKDSRIVYLSNENNLKIVKTLNKGISTSKGKYIARIDADDICMPNRFELQINFLESNSNIAVLGTDMYFINENGKIIGRGIVQGQTSLEVKRELSRRCCLYHPSVMINYDLVGDKLYYDDNFLYAEDYELWLRLRKEFNFANLSSPMLKYRIHSNSLTHTFNDKAVKSMLAALAKHSDVQIDNELDRATYIELVRFPMRIGQKKDFNFVLNEFISNFEKDIQSIIDVNIRGNVRRNVISYILILTYFYVKNLKEIPLSSTFHFYRRSGGNVLDILFILKNYMTNLYRRVIFRYLQVFGL